MITNILPNTKAFEVEYIDKHNFKIKGLGYLFHLYKSGDGITSVQVLPSEKYSPPPRCVEYLYYEANSRLGLDAIEDFFDGPNALPNNLIDEFRHLILSLTL